MKTKLTALFAIFVITAVSCSKLDVVGSDSVRAFNELLHNAPQLVSEDAANGNWSISAPDGSACFIWGRVISQPSLCKVMIEFDFEPFIAAGLNPYLLPENFAVSEDKMFIGTSFELAQLPNNSDAAPLSMYEQIVKLNRSIIGYHGELDHYGIDLGNGNMFEWAKNLTANEKDIVFVLNPEPFIAAGADPARIDGWVFAKVTVDDKNGKPVQVDKLLKPFNLH
jgi:hypothetical protein